MSGELNYKSKYMELRSKYLNDIDVAFRLGFEQGQQQAAQDQMAQAQQQQAEMEAAQAQMMQGQPGQEMAPGQEVAPGEQPMEGQPQDPMAGQPTELDQHIAKLESMIQKSEDQDLKKSLQELVMVRKAELQAIQMKKSDQAIKGIVKALHKPAFKLGVQASHNLNSNAKQAVSMQHKIVSDLMEKMEAEEKRASADIKSLLNIEGLTKKE